jgi:hypothetical protein
MNSKEKKWIKDSLYKIFVIDNENDCQADDITEFLMELASKIGYSISEDL